MATINSQSNFESAREISLWPLVFLAALLPLIASHVSLIISQIYDYVPSGFPYVDGSTSISRAGRHGFANHFFRLLMLPAAVLQVLVWYLSWSWTQSRTWSGIRSRPQSQIQSRNQSQIQLRTKKRLSLVPYLGLAAGLCLALYTVFLGSDGYGYQLVRRYAVSTYFCLSYIIYLLFHQALSGIEVRSSRLLRWMFWLCVALLPLGILSVVASSTVADLDLKDRIENVVEWNLALLMIIWLFLWSLVLKRERARLKIL